jgi:hypothetical protein
LPDVLETLRKWVVVPRCEVTATIDGGDVERVGFVNPADAIRATLEANGADSASMWSEGEPTDGDFRVVEKTAGSVTAAFAVRWDRYFREWGFLAANRLSRRDTQDAFGMCVEGIRVEETTAGYADYGILAISNACGPEAPKTNVARSGIEATPGRTEMLRSIYESYLRHVADEAESLGAGRGLSLTWAAQEAEFLLRPLLLAEPRLSGREVVRPLEPRILLAAVRAAPIVLTERDGHRSLCTAADLDGEDSLWTVDSAYVRAAERLLREIPGAVSLSSVSEGFKTAAFDLPPGVTLVGYESYSRLYRTVLEGWEVQRVVVRRDERRVDLAWGRVGTTERWLPVVAPERLGGNRPNRAAANMYVAKEPVAVDGRTDEVAVLAQGVFYLFSDTPVAQFLHGVIPNLAADRGLVPVREFLQASLTAYLSRAQPPENLRDFVEVAGLRDPDGGRRQLAVIEDDLDVDAYVTALESTGLTSFDTSGWARRDFPRYDY